jgi:hypothetical protein
MEPQINVIRNPTYLNHAGFCYNRGLSGQLRQKSPHIGWQEECVKSAELNSIKVNQISAIKPKDELYLA